MVSAHSIRNHRRASVFTVSAQRGKQLGEKYMCTETSGKFEKSRQNYIYDKAGLCRSSCFVTVEEGHQEMISSFSGLSTITSRRERKRDHQCQGRVGTKKEMCCSVVLIPPCSHKGRTIICWWCTCVTQSFSALQPAVQLLTVWLFITHHPAYKAAAATLRVVAVSCDLQQ